MLSIDYCQETWNHLRWGRGRGSRDVINWIQLRLNARKVMTIKIVFYYFSANSSCMFVCFSIFFFLILKRWFYFRFHKSIIKSREAMTYEAAQNRIDNPEDTSNIAARLDTGVVYTRYVLQFTKSSLCIMSVDIWMIFYALYQYKCKEGQRLRNDWTRAGHTRIKLLVGR